MCVIEAASFYRNNSASDYLVGTYLKLSGCCEFSDSGNACRDLGERI